MRTLATMADSACGYTGAVVGVIAVASIAVFNLQAKAQRHWDADVDRIVAKQQEKKHLAAWAASEKTDPAGVASDTGMQPAPFTVDSAGGGSIFDPLEFIGPQRAQVQPAKRNSHRAERRTQNLIPNAVIALPKFAINAATTNFLKLR